MAKIKRAAYLQSIDFKACAVFYYTQHIIKKWDRENRSKKEDRDRSGKSDT